MKHKFQYCATIILTCAFMTSSMTGESSQFNRNGFELSVGVTTRQFGDLSTYSIAAFSPQNLPLVVAAGGTQGSLNTVGSNQTMADRTYADGFVRIGAGTELDGLTPYWGFQNASQIAAGSVNLRSDPLVTTNQISSTDLLDGDQSFATGHHFGPELKIAYRMQTSAALKWRIIAGVSVNQIRHRQSTSTFRQTQQSEVTREWVQDSYDLGGILPPLAPYIGSATGPGPLIANVPTTRTIVTEGPTITQQAELFNNIDYGLNLRVYSWNLGVSSEIKVATSWSLSAGTGLTLNTVEGANHMNEVLLVRHNSGHSEALETITLRHRTRHTSWGYNLNIAINWQLSDSLRLYTYTRWDWSESVEGRLGQGKFEWDMNAVSFGAGFTFAF
ncbi:MAG: hypothetical protein LR015_12765 [Verrucomicrobia bacterium]|nr:hypothetical protein [Verrucomicrobiota bacterium]